MLATAQMRAIQRTVRVSIGRRVALSSTGPSSRKPRKGLRFTREHTDFETEPPRESRRLG